MTGDPKEERLLLLGGRGRSRGDGDAFGLTGSVLDLSNGLGPREKFCVPRTWGALGGCAAGNSVKLDRGCDGEVARRCGTGGIFAVKKSWMSQYTQLLPLVRVISYLSTWHT